MGYVVRAASDKIQAGQPTTEEAGSLKGLVALSPELSAPSLAEGLAFFEGLSDGRPFSGPRNDQALIDFLKAALNANPGSVNALNGLVASGALFLSDYSKSAAANPDPTVAMQTTVAHALSMPGL